MQLLSSMLISILGESFLLRSGCTDDTVSCLCLVVLSIPKVFILVCIYRLMENLFQLSYVFYNKKLFTVMFLTYSCLFCFLSDFFSSLPIFFLPPFLFASSRIFLLYFRSLMWKVVYVFNWVLSVIYIILIF